MNKSTSYFLQDRTYAQTASPETLLNINPIYGRVLLSSNTAGLLFLFLALGHPAVAAEGRLNLPQTRQLIPLDEKAKAVTQDYFSRSRAAGELPAAFRDSLLRVLPADYVNTCNSIVQQWGSEIPPGAKFWRIRLLNHEGARAWLAFRCGSPEQDPGPFYDERLALLHLDTAGLELIPLGPDTKDDDVYHLEFMKRLALKNAEGFAFRVSKDDNPCCDGPESRSQDRLVIIADTPHGAVESLSVVIDRDDTSHCDDPEVDTETTRHSEVKYERETNNYDSALSITFHETVVDTHWESGKPEPQTISDQSDTQRFRWNAATFKFEEAH
jgi:hypothetical protein